MSPRARLRQLKVGSSALTKHLTRLLRVVKGLIARHGGPCPKLHLPQRL